MRNWKLLAIVALLATAALHYTTVPRSIWEFDESFFAMAVEKYEPLQHHPPPPGYPIYIGFAKLIALFTGDPLQALLATSIIAVAAGLVTWFLAFREITGEPLIAILGSVLLYVSPAVLVSGTLPQSDAGALALLGLAAWACAKGEPQFAAIACAACIGWRLQFSIEVVPMFLASLFLMKQWRDRAMALAVFGVACLVWFVPLVVATNGPELFWKWLSSQAAYYAAHDADLSRSGYSPGLIGLRFLAHPWGPKWLSLPLLAIAAGGATLLLIKKNVKVLPLAVGAAVYLAFALATMDPADAVRYAIPGLPVIALFAAVPVVKLAAIGALIAIAYASGAMAYALPVVRARATTDAPPSAAAKYIRANVPKNAIVLYDLPLRPQAEYLLRGWQVMRIDAGLAKYGGDPSVPMVVLANGERGEANGVTYHWPDTDAYRKLTRQHYGAVSVIPLPPSERFRVIKDIHAPERTREGQTWRWVGAHGEIELPSFGATHARFTFRTPPDYAFDRNRVDVLVNGTKAGAVEIARNGRGEVVVPIGAGPTKIEIVPLQTFVPAKIPGANNRDARTLSVMLTRVEQLGSRPASR